MVYKTAQQKILIFLVITTFFITLISGETYWKMWSVVPITFFLLYLTGKLPSLDSPQMSHFSCRLNVHERERLLVRAKLLQLERRNRARLLMNKL